MLPGLTKEVAPVAFYRACILLVVTFATGPHTIFLLISSTHVPRLHVVHSACFSGEHRAAVPAASEMMSNRVASMSFLELHSWNVDRSRIYRTAY